MCGIYGEIALPGGVPPDREVLRAMGRAIVHRGPDDDGLHVDSEAAIGLRRLSIIDVATGHQPIANEDGTVVVVCNGEIYNFRELRQRLTAAGHRFRTGSDVEVIVHLYEEHGDDFVGHLRGMFGFALWDATRRRLVVGRDRLGIKPVYFARLGGRIAFSSEAKAILARPDYTPSLDEAALRQFLSLGYLPAPHSMFGGIRKLMPGSVLVVEGDRIDERAYWTFGVQPEPGRDEASWIEEIRTALADSIESQMVSDVPIGAFLSGGIDSSTIVAHMARFSAQPVKTYAIGYSGSTGAALYNELDHARRIAARYGTDHHEIEVQPAVIGLLPGLVWHMDEPTSDSALITSSLVSEFARRDVKVILSGVGGDELFGGYDRYQLPHLVGQFRRIPGPLRRGLLNPLLEALPVARHTRLLNLLRAARKVALVADKDSVERYQEVMEVFSAADLAELLPGGSATARPVLTTVLERYLGHAELDQMMAADLGTQLPDDLLLLTDKVSMAHSLECRVPLLDERLVDLAARLPASLRVRGRQTRYILKKALAGILPPETLQRPKRGFGAPFGAWFAHELAPVTDEVLGPRGLQRRGLMNPRAIDGLIADHRARKADHTDHLVALTTLEIWCRLHLDRESPAAIADGLGARRRPG
ncbi:MAG: asparagine synthase (glutamine-hydrolyzing) [Gammaproteobacteria bacterium]|nr:asparagine synthase (glutamine-hydrolyzing) [Gammaproteobacteria bacterium]